MAVEGLLPRAGVAARVSVNSKRQALIAAAEVAARVSGLPLAVVQAALLKREKAGSTGVGDGVALPHGRVEGLRRACAVFLRLETPVDFKAVDDQPVDLIFALLAPAEAPGSEHLQALAKISRLLRQADLRRQLRQAQTADAIYALLVREEAQPSAA
ncbi:MAG: PTS sugar transporter subunit IIA [Pseudomonadota bacterium]|nr:PTS sugar transporter subunit IIA [Pseudomonadota bacterium]